MHRPRLCSESATLPSADIGGEPLVLPTTQKPKRSRTEERYEEFMKRFCETFREVVSTPERTPASVFGKAMDCATTHWPPFTGWNTATCSFDVFPDVAFERLYGGQDSARTPKGVPTSRVSGVSGALIADSQEFRSRGVTGPSKPLR